MRLRGAGREVGERGEGGRGGLFKCCGFSADVILLLPN